MRDYEELWGHLKSFVIEQGDQMVARMMSSSSWEDFKNNQGRLQAIRMMADQIARLEISGDDDNG
jgi:hypothetical protein